jgi:hypothetical protein
MKEANMDAEQVAKHPLIEFFDKCEEMGIQPKLKSFGKGYRLEVGNVHIYFENEALTYTGWGMSFMPEEYPTPKDETSEDKWRTDIYLENKNENR